MRPLPQGGYRQENDAPEDILNTLLDADSVYCEMPFCYSDNTDNEPILWNGVIDVIYEKAGKWYTIDYKTNADGSDLDTKYQGQLAAYVKAVKAIMGIDVESAKTYHIDI